MLELVKRHCYGCAAGFKREKELLWHLKYNHRLNLPVQPWRQQQGQQLGQPRTDPATTTTDAAATTPITAEAPGTPTPTTGAAVITTKPGTYICSEINWFPNTIIWFQGSWDQFVVVIPSTRIILHHGLHWFITLHIPPAFDKPEYVTQPVIMTLICASLAICK